MSGRARHLLALFVVATLVVQAAGVGVVAGQQMGGSSMDAADEIYVEGNGDAVLVYESEGQSDSFDRFEFGTSVDANLAYMLLTDSVEEEPEVRGRFGLTAARQSLAADGNISFPRPDALQEFDLDASARSNENTSRADFSMSTVFQDQSGVSALLSEASTTGEMTTSGDRFTLDTSFQASTNVPMVQEQSLDASLTESGDTYTLEVDWDRPVTRRQAQLWANESIAERRLQQQVQAIALAAGGSATVDLQENTVTRSGNTPRLSQEYTVEVTGIDEALEQQVQRSLERDPQFSSEQARRVASSIGDLQINEASVQYTVEGREITGEVTLDVGGFNDLLLAYLEVLESMDAGGAEFGANVEQLRGQFEAQQAAGLEQTFSWDASLATGEGSNLTLDLAAQLRSTNWGAYVDEVQSRDLPFVATSAALTGDIAGDRVELAGNASMTGEALFGQLFQGLPSGDEMSGETGAMLNGLRDSNPQQAALEASYGADGLRIEGAAAFGNLAALRDAISNESDLPTVTEIVGRADEDGGASYVRVSGAVGEDASESDVRALAYVDEETTIYMPGEGERDFPSMDTERAREFLGQSSGSDGPGFGPFVAIAALAAVALLGYRRR